MHKPEALEDRCQPVYVHTYGLDRETWEKLFDRVADAAHALDEAVSCSGGNDCSLCEDVTSPDWADIREAARKAGLKLSRRTNRRKGIRGFWLWYALDGDDPMVEYHRSSTGVYQVHLRGPRGYTALLEFTPDAVLEAARLVGLGGER